MVLEDLHWCDAASLSLLFHLLRQVQRPGLLVVGTYRPEDVEAGRGSERHPLEQVVAELVRYQGNIIVPAAGVAASGRQFIDALLDAEPNSLGDEFRGALAQVTDGQALFTTEIVHSMKEDGRLVKDGSGRWVAAASLDWTLVPARVEGVIGERVDRLPAFDRELLGIVSVQGVRFSAEIAAHAGNVPEPDAIRSLSRNLDRRHNLVSEIGESRIGTSLVTQYEFCHALVQRWVYDDLSLGERRLIHGSVASAIQELAGAEQESVLTTLAYHLERAGQPERACACWTTAGERFRRAVGARRVQARLR